MSFRIGQGFDVHAFAAGRRLILGGVHVPHPQGLAGHSDADVLCHAIADALLGAAGLGDIGRHFPDTDLSFKDADSLELLAQVGEKLAIQGWNVVNIDATVVAQSPRLADYIAAMCGNIAKVLHLDVSQVNIKATTTEKLGFTGRGEGIATMAVALLGAS
ncbi:MAG: 2-C-methyl-D-erythritol 2,4-cyclodiphosphate synthase [Mariprofundaceae bacterium]